MWCILPDRQTRYVRMHQQHPEFENMLWCPAVNEWVVDDYDVGVTPTVTEGSKATTERARAS